MIFKNREIMTQAKVEQTVMNFILQSDDAKKFIKYVIKTYTKNPAFFMQSNNVEWEDLYQACLIGLYNGIKNLDLKRTPQEWVRYIYVTIQGEIKNFARSNQSNSIVVSQKIRLLYPKYILFYREFREQYDKDPTVQDTVKEFQISRSEAFDLIYGMQQVVSYYAESGEVIQEYVLNHFENLEKKVVNRILIEQFMYLLNPKERKVLYLFYYLGLKKTEIAAEIGCGNTMVQKHILNAFNKIKKHHVG